ncbi:MAG: hypothetical protein ACYDD1_13425 [Caulobacteraceae bacterium]
MTTVDEIGHAEQVPPWNAPSPTFSTDPTWPAAPKLIDSLDLVAGLDAYKLAGHLAANGNPTAASGVGWWLEHRLAPCTFPTTPSRKSAA